MNRYQLLVRILTEDDANRQIAAGFLTFPELADILVIDDPAGGWTNARNQLASSYSRTLTRFDKMHVVVVVDCDGDAGRIQKVKRVVQPELSDRVFVLGVLSEPEALRREVASSFGQIGLQLAAECKSGRRDLWNHKLLVHNLPEVNRFATKLGLELFPP